MFKALFIGIWVASILSGSVYYFGNMQAKSGNSSKPTASYFGGLDYISLDPMTVVVIRENEVRGYIIVEAVFTIKQSDLPRLSVPMKYLLRDLIIESVHNNPDIDIFRLAKFDLGKFQDQLRTDINVKMGEETVHDILIQKINFISKDDVRDKQLRRS